MDDAAADGGRCAGSPAGDQQLLARQPAAHIVTSRITAKAGSSCSFCSPRLGFLRCPCGVRPQKIRYGPAFRLSEIDWVCPRFRRSTSASSSDVSARDTSNSGYLSLGTWLVTLNVAGPACRSMLPGTHPLDVISVCTTC